MSWWIFGKPAVLELIVLQLKRRDDAHITSAEKASSVPGRMQTAVVESSGAANPHVPVMKLWVVSLSPTFAGRDLTLCRLKSHMAEELLCCESPTNPDPLAKNGPTSQHARLAVVGCFELPQFAQLPRKCLRDPACDPFRGWIECDVDPDKVSTGQPDDNEDIEQIKANGRKNEQGHSGHVRRVVPKKCPPSLWPRPASLDQALRDAHRTSLDTCSE